MISLIVTVYNKAPFLKRCLASVYNQYDKSAQIIVVDDGSIDGSGEICDYYEKLGFEVYHTKNRGVSEARNFGISKAKGDYIAFLDADDVLMPDATAKMKKIVETGYNLYQFGQFRGRTFDTVNFIPRFSNRGLYSFSYIPRYWVLVWNKLYKLSFLNANNIRFRKNMQFGEDTVFNAECILANGGIYHEEAALVVHLLDDNNSLCRGNMTLDKIEKLDKELCALADRQTNHAKIKWMEVAINEHRNSKLYQRMGFSENPRGKYDIVYFLKTDVSNEELVYSLRSVEKNWHYRRVCFYGGCPENLKPDRLFRTEQEGLNKWQKVRNMIIEACKNDDISEEFWLFNDDFFILRPVDENMPPQYNGDLVKYAEYIERKQGAADNHTCSLREAAKVLKEAGLTTYNYEVHKPMLINRQKALEVFDKFPNIHAFRSLYGNYWQIGGTSMHDMKIKILNYGRMDQVDSFWQFLSTSDESFKGGNAGEYIKRKFNKKSRFEKEAK